MELLLEKKRKQNDIKESLLPKQDIKKLSRKSEFIAPSSPVAKKSDAFESVGKIDKNFRKTAKIIDPESLKL